MGSVKKYHVGDSGLVEGEALGRITVYLAADFDAALGEIAALEKQLDETLATGELALDAGMRVDELETQVHSLEQRRQAEQQACQAAERRIEELLQAKGPDEPVAWIAESSEPAFYLSGSESTASTVAEHYREKGFEASVAPLYRHPAEQPAPVAVVLAEAREWLGDGKHADGLAREHWTPEYAALIDRIDATLSK